MIGLGQIRGIGMGASSSSDPLFSSVVLGLNFQSGTPFTDFSLFNNTITNVGGVAAGSNGITLDGTTQWIEVVTTSTGTRFDFGTGDLTIEAFVIPGASAGNAGRVVWSTPTAGGTRFLGRSGQFNTILYQVPGGAGSTGSWTTSASPQHIAYCVRGGLSEIYFQGNRARSVSAGGSSMSFTQGAAFPFRIGRDASFTYSNWLGQVVSFRITKGVARYSTATYVVPDPLFPTQ